jgi:hypothetical protein
MNQRVAVAAIFILFAAQGLVQTRSPELAAFVGVYVAEGSMNGRPVKHVLTLNGDTASSLRTLSEDGTLELSTATGTWLLDGQAVEISLVGSDDGQSATALTLHRADDALVAPEAGQSESGFAGLTFVRVDDGSAARSRQ